MAEQEEPKKGVVVAARESPENRIYSNVAQISMTAEECLIRFGIRTFDDPDVAESLVVVYLSLPHAKRVHAVLGNAIAKFESKFGEIEKDPSERMAQILEQSVEDNN